MSTSNSMILNYKIICKKRKYVHFFFAGSKKKRTKEKRAFRELRLCNSLCHFYLLKMNYVQAMLLNSLRSDIEAKQLSLRSFSNLLIADR